MIRPARVDRPKDARLDTDDDLAARLVRLHEAMCIADFAEGENARRLCLVATLGDTADDGLEGNFRERKGRRARHHRAGKDAQMRPTRNLKHRLQAERPAATEETHEASMAATTQRGERVEDGGVADDVEHRVDAFGMALADALGELG